MKKNTCKRPTGHQQLLPHTPPQRQTTRATGNRYVVTSTKPLKFIIRALVNLTWWKAVNMTCFLSIWGVSFFGSYWPILVNLTGSSFWKNGSIWPVFCQINQIPKIHYPRTGQFDMVVLAWYGRIDYVLVKLTFIIVEFGPACSGCSSRIGLFCGQFDLFNGVSRFDRFRVFGTGQYDMKNRSIWHGTVYRVAQTKHTVAEPEIVITVSSDEVS